MSIENTGSVDWAQIDERLQSPDYVIEHFFECDWAPCAALSGKPVPKSKIPTMQITNVDDFVQYDMPAELAVQRHASDGDLEAATAAAIELEPSYAAVNHLVTVLESDRSRTTYNLAYLMGLRIEDAEERKEALELLDLLFDKDVRTGKLGEIALYQL